MVAAALRLRRLWITTVAVAALAVAASSAAATSAAAATPRCVEGTTAAHLLGPAAPFTQFVLGDDRQINESEGRVAVGGNFTVATDGDVGFRTGFALPPSERPSLIVGDTLSADGTFLQLLSDRPGVLGTATYGRAYVPGTRDEGTFLHRRPPFSFQRSGIYLRRLASFLGGCPQTGGAHVGEYESGPGTLLLRRADGHLNVFHLTTTQLQSTRSVYLDVPRGSTTLVDVAGTAYSTELTPNADFWIRDRGLPGAPFVQVAHCGLGVSCFFNTSDGPIGPRPLPDGVLEVENHLLWNYPEAGSFRKGAVAWAGSILAPRAALQWGTTTEDPSAGLGPFEGQLVLASVDSGTSGGGLESHASEHTGGDLLFAGRLPSPEPTIEPPKPIEPPPVTEPPVIEPPPTPPGPTPPGPTPPGPTPPGPTPPGPTPPPRPIPPGPPPPRPTPPRPVGPRPILPPPGPIRPGDPGTVRGEDPSISIAAPVASGCGLAHVHVVVNVGRSPLRVAVSLDGRRLTTSTRRTVELGLSRAALRPGRHRIAATLVAGGQRARGATVLRVRRCSRRPPPPRFTG